MKDVTVTLSDTALWLRVRASEANRSVSSWLADAIEEEMRCREDAYEVAMARALARKPRKMAWVDGRRPTRNELHDRTGLR